MRLIVLAAACAPLALGACHSAAPPQARFDPADAAFIRKEGQATILGHAFLRDLHGGASVRSAAGEIVRLIPATAYARERFAHFYGQKKFLPALMAPTPEQDADYAAYTRTTKANATGRFTFEKLAPGRYFVTTQITWTPNGGLLSQGGAMYDEVEVTGKESEPIEVILSGN